mgnify:CR=1 FL=1
MNMHISKRLKNATHISYKSCKNSPGQTKRSYATLAGGFFGVGQKSVVARNSKNSQTVTPTTNTNQ